MYHWHCESCNALIQISDFYEGPYIEISKPASKDPLIIALKDTYQDTCEKCENQREGCLAISGTLNLKPIRTGISGPKNIMYVIDKHGHICEYIKSDEFDERDEHKVFYPVIVYLEVRQNGHVLVEYNGDEVSFDNPLGVQRYWHDHSDKPLPDYNGDDGSNIGRFGPLDVEGTVHAYSHTSCNNYESGGIELKLFVCRSCLEQLPKILRDNIKKDVTDFCEKNKNILKFYDDKNKWRDCGYPSLVTWRPITMFRGYNDWSSSNRGL